ncbi:thermonuclease family protein [Baekduia sp. Peel2402]|uniref:thermonuclease family protein n=1 Tax=Baekduia sp. Peel2402 TaxID=3458296 RepID=UPI00403E6623
MLRRFAPLLVILLAVAGGFVAGKIDGPDDPTSARVIRVVDGDTILVSLGGHEERVRYIGVDTPETVKPGAPVECFGKKASARNKELVAGRRVRLVRDAEERDRYGRLLAYVYREDDGLFVNASLVLDGYATALTIPPNTAHAAQFRYDAGEARRAGRGLWNACSR